MARNAISGALFDQKGYVLDEIVQFHRDTKAARRSPRLLCKQEGCPPKWIITDKLGSYAAAKREIMPKVEHRAHGISIIGRRILTFPSENESE
jgi:transposase-like protein